MVLMPGFQSTRLVTEGALEPFFFLYTDDSIQGNPETCKQSSIMLNYEVKNTNKRILVIAVGGWTQVLRFAYDTIRSNLMLSTTKILIILDRDIKDDVPNFIKRSILVLLLSQAICLFKV